MNPEWRQLYLSRAKLKAVSRTSALIAGFAMVAMVEVQLQHDTDYGSWLLICFSITTTALVSVHLFALMISTCMLPNIEAVSSFHQSNAIRNSPHQRMRKYVEIAWILSTGVGLVLFLVEIVLLIWLKFIPLKKKITSNTITDHPAAWAATFILVPVVVLFAGFAFHFYMTLAKHRYSLVGQKMVDLNQLAAEHEEILPAPVGDLVETNFHDCVSRMNSINSNQLTVGHPQPSSDLNSHQSSLSHYSSQNV